MSLIGKHLRRPGNRQGLVRRHGRNVIHMLSIQIEIDMELGMCRIPELRVNEHIEMNMSIVVLNCIPLFNFIFYIWSINNTVQLTVLTLVSRALDSKSSVRFAGGNAVKHTCIVCFCLSVLTLRVFHTGFPGSRMVWRIAQRALSLYLWFLHYDLADSNMPLKGCAGNERMHVLWSPICALYCIVLYCIVLYVYWLRTNAKSHIYIYNIEFNINKMIR